jgi:DNA-binding Xre family transcriptional regulator|nr:MAG TPA: SOS-response transcriptional repressor [Caudoviricetes sp.]
MADKTGDAIIIGNIRRILIEKGIKHVKVAENLGMTGNSFSGMLSGRKVIQARYIPIIAKTLGCTCDEIFRIPEENNKAAQ